MNSPGGAGDTIQEVLDFNERKGYPTGEDNALFVSRRGRRITARQVQNIIRSLRDDAEIDVEMTPHTLRHTFATRVYKKTGNLQVVQTLLGHSSIQTTEIYTHLGREDLQKAVEML